MKSGALISEEFWSQFRGLVDERTRTSILKGIDVLYRDPLPDGDRKKKLKDWPDDCYRLKVGDYRVGYSLKANQLEVLWVRLREDAYRKAARRSTHKSEHPAVPRPAASPMPKPRIASSGWSDDDPPLPTQIDPQLLEGLHVPLEYHQILLNCQTLNDLCEAQVPEDIRDWIFDCVTEPNRKQILEGRRLMVEDINDLERKLKGEFIPFLLKLDSEQERVVHEITQAGGPALVTGGPGSGKSVVALYSARSIVRRLRDAGIARPQVLFATYTKALTRSLEQQLHEILDKRDGSVEVSTADALARNIVEEVDGRPRIEYRIESLKPLINDARKRVLYREEGARRQSLQSQIGRLPENVMLTEIGSVIEAREIGSVEEYLATKVPNRPSRFTDDQLRALWLVGEEFRAILQEQGKMTFSQLRRRALEIVRNGQWTRRYDAVIVDEAQDLEMSLLRLLITLCGNRKQLLITADANQSIYPVWTNVLGELDFSDRAWILPTGHRTTRQIIVAAQAYVREGIRDNSNASTNFRKTGSTPFLRYVKDIHAESELLATFFSWTTKKNYIGYGHCAVLVASERAGRAIAGRLNRKGVQAAFMNSQNLDLNRPGVKVLTLYTAKGLEFTAVAIAGFFDGKLLGPIPDQRRLMFVGMTRAMRELMVIKPAGEPSIRDDFDSRLWDIGDYPNQT